MITAQPYKSDVPETKRRISVPPWGEYMYSLQFWVGVCGVLREPLFLLRPKNFVSLVYF